MGVLITKVSQNGHIAVQADEDADVLICNTVIALACKGKIVTVVGKDVDLMCILVACTLSTSEDVNFLKSGLGTWPSHSYYSIHNIQSKYPKLQESILFAHAISGCDMASVVFSKSKIVCVKKILKKDMDDIMLESSMAASDREKIFTATCKYFLLLYGVKRREKNVEELR